MAVTWLQGAVGRLVGKGGLNMGGAAFEIYSLNGGQLFLPEDTEEYPGRRGDGLERAMVPGLQFQGPCVIIYLDGADAARVRAMFGLPEPKDILPAVMNGGGLIRP
jgi:hypothetical protein